MLFGFAISEADFVAHVFRPIFLRSSSCRTEAGRILDHSPDSVEIAFLATAGLGGFLFIGIATYYFLSF